MISAISSLSFDSSTGLISVRNGSLIADAGINNEGSMAMTLGIPTIFNQPPSVDLYVLPAKCYHTEILHKSLTW